MTTASRRVGCTQDLAHQPGNEPVLGRIMLMVWAGVLTAALYGSFPVVKAVAEKMLTR